MAGQAGFAQGGSDVIDDRRIVDLLDGQVHAQRQIRRREPLIDPLGELPAGLRHHPSADLDDQSRLFG